MLRLGLTLCQCAKRHVFSTRRSTTSIQTTQSNPNHSKEIMPGYNVPGSSGGIFLDQEGTDISVTNNNTTGINCHELKGIKQSDFWDFCTPARQTVYHTITAKMYVRTKQYPQQLSKIYEEIFHTTACVCTRHMTSVSYPGNRSFRVERPSSARGDLSQILHKFHGNARVIILFAIRNFDSNAQVIHVFKMSCAFSLMQLLTLKGRGSRGGAWLSVFKDFHIF